MLFQEDRHLSFERSHEGSFPKLQYIQELYDERIDSLTKQVSVFFHEISHDEIFKAMRENSLSQEYASQRASELFTEIMKSEQESTILKLQNELVEYKTLNLKLEYEKKQITANFKELEDHIRRLEIEKHKLLSDCDSATTRLVHAENQFHDTIKKKEFDMGYKIENNVKRLENALQDTEAKYFAAKLELESLAKAKKHSEHLTNEIENLRKELKNHEKLNYREIQELKIGYEANIEGLKSQIAEAEKNNDSIKNQFKNYQKQSEELAGNQQSVIKTLVDKSKRLKQKIISQKSKIGELSKESSQHLESFKENQEKTIEDFKEKIKMVEKEAAFKENEILAKHQIQISQLQVQYQGMMDLKLAEMQKEVNLQIARSQEHDKEVKFLMDLKMKEIEKEYVSVAYHERSLSEKESFVVRKFNLKIEEIARENESVQQDLKNEIIEIRRVNEELNEMIDKLRRAEEQLKKEREKLVSELTKKSSSLKEAESSISDVEQDHEQTKAALQRTKQELEDQIQVLRKTSQKNSDLTSAISDLQSEVNSLKQNLKLTKSQHEQILSEKIDKSFYNKLKEKSDFHELELENKNSKIAKLENEIANLTETLTENNLKRTQENNNLEIEQSKHMETKRNFKELEGYSQELLREVEIREGKIKELKMVIEQYKQELARSQALLEQKSKDFLGFQQDSFKRENETRNRFILFTEKTKKYLKHSIFYLKSQISSITELFEHEFSSMNKSFSTFQQEISIKIIEMQLKFRKDLDIKSENYTSDIKSYYRSKFLQLEEYISDENVHWNDPESEGVRRAVKSILEKKYIAQIEIKSLRESLASSTEQNENLYRENQKLQIRLHANNEAFDQLQREVAEEANKIKNRLESTGGKGIEMGVRGNYFRS